MAPIGSPPDPQRAQYAYLAKLGAVGGEIGCLTLIIVLAAVFGGIWLDRLLGTKPVIMLILVLGSAPLSLFLTFLLATRAVKDINPPIPPGGKSNLGKEEEDW